MTVTWSEAASASLLTANAQSSVCIYRIACFMRGDQRRIFAHRWICHGASSEVDYFEPQDLAPQWCNGLQ